MNMWKRFWNYLFNSNKGINAVGKSLIFPSPIGARSKLLIDFVNNEVTLKDKFGPSVSDEVCEPVDQSIREIEKQHKQVTRKFHEISELIF